MRLVEARCAHQKHCYPETPLGSHPTSRVSQWKQGLRSSNPRKRRKWRNWRVSLRQRHGLEKARLVLPWTKAKAAFFLRFPRTEFNPDLLNPCAWHSNWTCFIKTISEDIVEVFASACTKAKGPPGCEIPSKMLTVIKKHLKSNLGGIYLTLKWRKSHPIRGFVSSLRWITQATVKDHLWVLYIFEIVACCYGLCVPKMFITKTNTKENWGEFICLEKLCTPPPPPLPGNSPGRNYIPPPGLPRFLAKGIFDGRGVGVCILRPRAAGILYPPPPLFIHPSPLEGYFQGWGRWGCRKFGPENSFVSALRLRKWAKNLQTFICNHFCADGMST